MGPGGDRRQETCQNNGQHCATRAAITVPHWTLRQWQPCRLRDGNVQQTVGALISPLLFPSHSHWALLVSVWGQTGLKPIHSVICLVWATPHWRSNNHPPSLSWKVEMKSEMKEPESEHCHCRGLTRLGPIDWSLVWMLLTLWICSHSPLTRNHSECKRDTRVTQRRGRSQIRAEEWSLVTSWRIKPSVGQRKEKLWRFSPLGAGCAGQWAPDWQV